MTEMITAPEFLGVVAGGEAAGGNYVWVTLRLGDKDQTMLIEKSRVGVLMSGVATAAAIARKARVRLNPDELSDTGLDAAYALDITDVSVGRSTDQVHTILEMQMENRAGPSSLYLAMKRGALLKLRAACDRALVLLAGKAGEVASN